MCFEYEWPFLTFKQSWDLLKSTNHVGRIKQNSIGLLYENLLSTWYQSLLGALVYRISWLIPPFAEELDLTLVSSYGIAGKQHQPSTKSGQNISLLSSYWVECCILFWWGIISKRQRVGAMNVYQRILHWVTNSSDTDSGNMADISCWWSTPLKGKSHYMRTIAVES